MRLFAQLSWYFRREWRRYLGAVALLVIIAMLQLVPPKVVGIVVDGVTEQHFTTGQILMWIATMVLIAVVVYLLRYVWRVLLFGASYQLAVELREDYYRQLSRLVSQKVQELGGMFAGINFAQGQAAWFQRARRGH